MADYDSSMLAEALGYDAYDVKILLLLMDLKQDATLQKAIWVSDKVFAVVSGLGILTNLFCIFILLHMKDSLKTSLRLLLSLSVADTLRSTLDIVWVFYPFDTMRFPLTQGRSASGFVYVMRRVLTSFNILSDLSGLITTAMLAMVIFLAVKNPLSYNSLMSKRRGVGITLFIWTSGILIIISYNSILEGLKYTSDSKRPMSYLEGQITSNVVTGYSLFSEAIFAFIIVLNIAIFIQVKITTIKSTNSRRLNRLVVVLVLIIINYSVTCLPLVYYFVSGDDATSYEFLSYFVLCVMPVLQGCRSFGNSLVYTVRLPEIQKEARQIFCTRGYFMRRSTRTTSLSSSSGRGSRPFRKSTRLSSSRSGF